MKKEVLLIVLALISIKSFSQDLIIRNSGENITCKIDKVDSLRVYFTINNGSFKQETYLFKDKIKEIIYNYNKKDVTFQADTIIILKKGASFGYYHRGIKMPRKQISGLLTLNPLAYSVYKDSKSSKVLSSILGFTGGFLIGWNIGAISMGEYPNLIMLGGGVALIGVAIPISISSRKELHRAIEIYNSGFKKTATIDKKIYLGANSNGLGLRLAF